MRILLLTALCSFFCFIAAFMPAVANSKLPTFGIIDWFPFGWTEQGEVRGMFVEVADTIDQALRIKSSKVVSPVPRVLRAMEVGEFDFTITYRDPAMLGSVKYILNVGCLRSAIASFKTKPIHKLEQLNGLRVAYPGGGYFVKKFLPELRLDGVEVSRTEIMFRMAFRQRLDAFIINDAVWYGYKNNLNPHFKVSPGLWPLLAEPYYLETLPVAISVSKGSYQVGLANKIQALKESRAFKRALFDIYKKYELPNAMACLTTDLLS